ncbi:MAG: DUF5654 family protein [Patescibacteria group bacterium]
MKQSDDDLRGELRERTMGYIIAAFGVVAGLAWNDAVKAMIEYAYPLPQNSILAKIIYALIITFAVVLVTAYLARLLRIGVEKKG